MATDPNNPAAPRRTTDRRRTLKSGKLVLSDWTVMDCRVRDLSGTGARVEFGAPTDLPEEVRLLLESDNLLIPAKVIWRRGMAAGLQFTGPGETPPKRF